MTQKAVEWQPFLVSAVEFVHGDQGHRNGRIERGSIGVVSKRHAVNGDPVVFQHFGFQQLGGHRQQHDLVIMGLSIKLCKYI